MPVVNPSTYLPPALFRNKHINTIYSNLCRPVKGIFYERVRIETPDNDFIDLDFSRINSNVIVILAHGLEGSSGSIYIKGMSKAINNTGWDCVALNLRGCSGEPNRLLSSYHSGKTDDLETVINYITNNFSYTTIFLAGFSLGGNIVLKYAGEQGKKIPEIISAVAAISVPCDLRSSVFHLKKTSSRIYLEWLLRPMKKKLTHKKKKFPDAPFTLKQIHATKDIMDFDNLYTAPIHGFRDAEDYWQKCSSKQHLPNIAVPSLLINAADDPFFPDECFPFDEAKLNPNFYFEAPRFGGHVGFGSGFRLKSELWHEERVVVFFKEKKGI